MAVLAEKNWDRYVAQAELVSRTNGFQVLRDRILERAQITGEETVLDLGSGTGLLTLPAAEVAGRVWAVDISAQMCAHLAAKALSADQRNIEPVVASAVCLPLVSGSIDVAISNYCLHHLGHEEKLVALGELHRVLRPGGRLILGDMMFTVALRDRRDRAVVAGKVRALLAKGPGGAWRLARNGMRLLTGRWERPASGGWWQEALATTGFEGIELELTDHEGGIVEARR
ncbi:MAG: class I SAM-dependent methyltransferase [Actinobacteria bacterium]|nr:class I SAM-dependent methyltransferase [Actinomycetota bacterium]